MVQRPVRAASKIICKCQSILTVCGDVFQITIYNSNDNSDGNSSDNDNKPNKQWQKVKPKKDTKNKKREIFVNISVFFRVIFNLFRFCKRGRICHKI